MAGAQVAVAGCRRSHEADACDLTPDPDAEPLRQALEELGVKSTFVSWDDPAVTWAAFSHVVVSSTWDSVDRPVEYLGWARSVAGVSNLVNPFEVIEWNLDKVHQRELADAGVPVIPTIWVTPVDRGFEWPAGREVVVKPSVSAGGRETARYAQGDRAAGAHVRRLQADGRTVMVQEYLEAIDVVGEVDLVFLAGVFSHAVRKLPLLRAGDGVVERAWERMAWAGPATPSSDEFDVARGVVAFLMDRFGLPPVYCRVDLVTGGAGAPLLLEVELIDPYLSLDVVPAGAQRLAQAIVEPLRTGPQRR
jgi:hypothetical protein